MACSVLALMCVADVLHHSAGLLNCFMCQRAVLKQDLYLVGILLNEIIHEPVLFGY